MIKLFPSLKMKYKPTWEWITRSVILIWTWKRSQLGKIKCTVYLLGLTLPQSETSACTFFLSVRRVIFCLETVTLSGHYPTRCTRRRKPYAHKINYWVIPGPGAVHGCFPGISTPQLSSCFGSKPKQQENSVMCASCQDHFVQRKWNLSQSTLTEAVGWKLWRTLFFLLGTGFLAQRPTGMIPDCRLRVNNCVCTEGNW